MVMARHLDIEDLLKGDQGLPEIPKPSRTSLSSDRPHSRISGEKNEHGIGIGVLFSFVWLKTDGHVPEKSGYLEPQGHLWSSFA